MSEFSLLRTRLPWFPTIDYMRCRSDLRCMNFCPYDVFEWDADTGHPVVAHPYRCVPGCDSCAQNCDAHAISFPSRQRVCTILERLRRQERIPHGTPSIL